MFLFESPNKMWIVIFVITWRRAVYTPDVAELGRMEPPKVATLFRTWRLKEVP